MHYIHRISAVLLSTFVSLPALADLGSIYAAGKIGASFQNLNSIKNANPYFSDVVTPTSQTDTVLAYGGAVGYRWDYFFIPIRMEVDYTFRNNLTYNPEALVDGTDSFLLKTTVESQTVLGNLYFDFPLTRMFALFVGGGGGLAFNTTHTKTYSVDLDQYLASSTTDKDSAAWMVTAGLSLVPVEWFAIDASYRYSGLGSVAWNTYDDIDLKSDSYAANEVFLNFRFIVPSGKKSKPQPVQYRPAPAPEIEAEPAYIPPRTKAPAYKPTTKAPAYEPHPKKGADYQGKAPTYNNKSQGYNSDRAKPVSRGRSTST